MHIQQGLEKFLSWGRVEKKECFFGVQSTLSLLWSMRPHSNAYFFLTWTVVKDEISRWISQTSSYYLFKILGLISARAGLSRKTFFKVSASRFLVCGVYEGISFYNTELYYVLNMHPLLLIRRSYIWVIKAVSLTSRLIILASVSDIVCLQVRATDVRSGVNN